MPLFLVINEVALIYPTVAIDEHALAMHLIVHKVSLIAAASNPHVNT